MTTIQVWASYDFNSKLADLERYREIKNIGKKYGAEENGSGTRYDVHDINYGECDIDFDVSTKEQASRMIDELKAQGFRAVIFDEDEWTKEVEEEQDELIDWE